MRAFVLTAGMLGGLYAIAHAVGVFGWLNVVIGSIVIALVTLMSAAAIGPLMLSHAMSVDALDYDDDYEDEEEDDEDDAWSSRELQNILDSIEREPHITKQTRAGVALWMRAAIAELHVHENLDGIAVDPAPRISPSTIEVQSQPYRQTRGDQPPECMESSA